MFANTNMLLPLFERILKAPLTQTDKKENEMRRSFSVVATMVFAVISIILFQTKLFADDQVTLHIGGTVSPKHSWYKGAELFGAEVEDQVNQLVP